MRGWTRKESKVGQECMGCTERHVGCHSTCEKYINAVKEVEEEREKLREMKRVEEQWLGYANKRKGRNVI